MYKFNSQYVIHFFYSSIMIKFYNQKAYITYYNLNTKQTSITKKQNKKFLILIANTII